MATLDNATLNRTPETENPYDDTLAISARIDRVLDTDKWSHSLFESSWFRNILMIAGAQWIIKDRNGRWQRKSTPFIGFPRTYTNKVAQIYNDLVGQLVQGKRIPLSCQPADPDDMADVGISEIGESLIDLIRIEAEEDEKQHEVASWLVSTGNCFGIANYDLDERFGVAKVPYQMCADCGYGPIDPSELEDGVCPECESENLVEAPETPDGGKLVAEMPRGAIQLDICGPFEIRLDHRITRYRQLKRFVRQRRYDLDWAKEHWGGKKDEEGNWVGGINPDLIVGDSGDADPGQYYLDVLANTTSAYRFGAGLYSNSANATGKTPKVTAYEFYELPTADFPEGIRAVRLGSAKDAIVEAGPLPTEYGSGVKQGQKYLPLVHWGYQRVPGRFWYKTPVDDVIPLQITRNVVEANINISVQRMGNSVWLNPKGSGVEIITGESGQVINYNPLAIGGTTPVKPERVPAELNNLGPLMIWMQRIDDAIERIAGTYFLQGGDAPPGVTAACLSLDTKALTKRGWKAYDELKFDDELYSVDPKTGEGVWAGLKNIHIYDYAGDMYAIDGNSVSACATPNHAWYVTRKDSNVIERVETRDLKPSDLLVSIPAVAQSESPEKDAFVELLGWIVTEGSYHIRKVGTVRKCKDSTYTMRTPSITVEINQSITANAENCERIENCLKANGIRHSTNIDKRTKVMRYRICGLAARQIQERFPDKRLTHEFITSLTATQLKLLCETMIAGDGSYETYRNGKPHFSCDLRGYDIVLMEQFQMAATLAGLQNTFSEGEPEDRNRHRSEKYSNIPYRVRIKNRPGYSCRHLLDKTTRISFENIRVWCPETTTGTWIARRNGKVYVTGNSALAFLSEKGQQSLSSVRAAWAEAWMQFYLYGIEIARQNWDEKRIRVIAGKNRKWQAEKFAKADLQGSLNIIIDYNALAPKSMATEQAKIMSLVQMGMINPADESMRLEVFKRFGALDLTGALNKDIEYAAKVQDHFIQDTEYIPQVRPLIDNSAILMAEAVTFAKTDEYDELPPVRQQLWLEYCKNLAIDVAARRLALTQAGIDPDVPATAEIPSGEAVAGAMAGAQDAALAQSGGIPQGMQAPDPRLGPNGEQPQIPDIGGAPEDYLGSEIPGQIKPPGSPREINLPTEG